jgi:hypothetical protein
MVDQLHWVLEATLAVVKSHLNVTTAHLEVTAPGLGISMEDTNGEAGNGKQANKPKQVLDLMYRQKLPRLQVFQRLQ